MRFRLLMLLCISFLLLGHSASRAQAPATPPTAGLSSFPGPSISAHPMAIIKARNLDSQNGWRLNWEIRTTLSAWVNDFYSGAYDGLHFAGLNYLATAYNKGTPIRIVGGSASYPWPLVVRADQNIKSVQDLKGKKLGIPKSSYIYAYMYAVFRQAGMNLEKDAKVDNIDVIQAPQLLERGDYDAALILVEHAIMLEQKSPDRFKVLLFPDDEVAKMLGRKTMYQVLTMRADWLDKNKDGARRIQRAFEQAQAAIDANIEQTVAILAPKTDILNGRGSGGANLPEHVVRKLYRDGFHGRKMRWYGVPAADLKKELMAEFQLYKDAGLIDQIPNEGILYTQ